MSPWRHDISVWSNIACREILEPSSFNKYLPYTQILDPRKPILYKNFLHPIFYKEYLTLLKHSFLSFLANFK